MLREEPRADRRDDIYSMVTFRYKGDWKKTEKWLDSSQKYSPMQLLKEYGEAGLMALSLATPIDTGETANSWTYKVTNNGDSYSIIWSNSNIVKGVPIAIILQYGHGTRNGGYVQGMDYINPALKAVFTRFTEELDEEMRKL